MQYYLSRQSPRLLKDGSTIVTSIEYQWQHTEVNRFVSSLTSLISRLIDRWSRLVEFTLRLGGANQQCFGTSPTDMGRDFKSIFLLTSCSNGVHWTIIDRFYIDDLLAPEYGYEDDLNKDRSWTTNLVPWVESSLTRKKTTINVWLNGDRWHIVVTIKTFGRSMTSPSERFHRLKNLHGQSKNNTSFWRRMLSFFLEYLSRSFQSKLIYIRPGFVLSFQVDAVNSKDAKTSLDFDDVGDFPDPDWVIPRLSNLVSSSDQCHTNRSESAARCILLSIGKFD